MFLQVILLSMNLYLLVLMICQNLSPTCLANKSPLVNHLLYEPLQQKNIHNAEDTLQNLPYIEIWKPGSFNFCFMEVLQQLLMYVLKEG
jgi:hypothetical protein